MAGFHAKTATFGGLIATLVGSPVHAAPEKMICVVEKAAGITYEDNRPARGAEINFVEGHKKFVLTIQPIQRTQFTRNWCMQSLKHWEGYLASGQPYPNEPLFKGGSEKDPSKAYDMRYNMGPMCFASTEAIVKFFDRDKPDRYVTYDFPYRSFSGLPGEWLTLYGKRFDMGEGLDSGPVVLSGTCEPIT